MGSASMNAGRRLHLGAFMRPVSIHTAWWRYPGSEPDANFNLRQLVSCNVSQRGDERRLPIDIQCGENFLQSD